MPHLRIMPRPHDLPFSRLVIHLPYCPVLPSSPTLFWCPIQTLSSILASILTSRALYSRLLNPSVSSVLSSPYPLFSPLALSSPSACSIITPCNILALLISILLLPSFWLCVPFSQSSLTASFSPELHLYLLLHTPSCHYRNNRHYLKDLLISQSSGKW